MKPERKAEMSRERLVEIIALMDEESEFYPYLEPDDADRLIRELMSEVERLQGEVVAWKRVVDNVQDRWHEAQNELVEANAERNQYRAALEEIDELVPAGSIIRNITRGALEAKSEWWMEG